MFRDELIISQINEIKKSIAMFTNELSDYSKEVNHGFLTQQEKDFFSFISKQIIFLKEVYEIHRNYNIKVLISDYYNYIVSIIKNEHRYIYLNERSIIENYTRWIVGVDVEVDHITTKIFEKLKKQMSLSDVDYSLIKEEYTVSCGYIHGSTLLNDNLSYVFRQCISNVVVFKNIGSYFNKIIKMIKIYDKLIILTYPDLIDHSFFRRKSVLQYLIGAENVDLLFEKLCKNL